MREQRHIFKVKIGRSSYMIAAQTFTDAVNQAHAYIDKERTKAGGTWADLDLRSVEKIHDAYDLLFTTQSELG